MIPKPLNGPFLIIGEGEQDRAFFKNLVQYHQLDGFDIGYAEGKNNFGDILDGVRVNENFQKISKIILVSDNDDDPSSSFQEVCQQIQEAGEYPTPPCPLKAAEVDGGCSLVVMMLPWKEEKGCLETLCLRAACDAWPDIKNCLDDYSSCVGVGAWSVSKKSKMRLRCLFASACRSDPNTGLTYAWERGEDLIPLDHSCFQPIVSYLRSVSSL